MVSHASPKLLARQWLQAYQFAPVFVAPLIILGASSNAVLAYVNVNSTRTSYLYGAAALLNTSIIPYTALYMEPGVNGAGKWKAQQLLREDGLTLNGRGAGTDKDTASETSKQWAEKVDMKTIAETWARTNAWRYVITGIALVLSTVANISIS
ncbi:hypothetical protein FB567DRAFT_585653 [Paraphoma chrysanthemicola]|uniref:DUF1772-domain-containing protein n=1 Tax=Paraphoma chrysanthemicola TaxID=798071 RepID=A0A8K0W3H4_9PLEO|nr:hypothetical protein FB567DRAFT_585653 [Paraphoma chrysanthemicola]